ncbi:MAG: hypothetical protein IKS52_04635 [Clostridia bacterium]|nr:hypothetical protein [Clostridia bacterium]
MYRIQVEKLSSEDENYAERINGEYENIIVICVKKVNEYGVAETRGLTSGDRNALIEALAANGGVARLCLRAALRRFRRWLLNDLPGQVNGQ